METRGRYRTAVPLPDAPLTLSLSPSGDDLLHHAPASLKHGWGQVPFVHDGDVVTGMWLWW